MKSFSKLRKRRGGQRGIKPIGSLRSLSLSSASRWSWEGRLDSLLLLSKRGSRRRMCQPALTHPMEELLTQKNLFFSSLRLQPRGRRDQ